MERVGESFFLAIYNLFLGWLNVVGDNYVQIKIICLPKETGMVISNP